MQTQERAEPNMIVSWKEPSLVVKSELPMKQVWLAAGLLAILALGVGIWQRDVNFYLAAIGCLVIAFSVGVQRKRPAGDQKISLSEATIQLDAHIYALTDFAGFWLQNDGKHVLINLEPRRGFLALTFAWRNHDADAARAHFLEVLHELEPREQTGDTLTRWLKL